MSMRARKFFISCGIFTSATHRITCMCCCFHTTPALAFSVSSIHQHQQQQQNGIPEVLDAGESESCRHGIKLHQGHGPSSSTCVGRHVDSYSLSPVFEECHSLWQWRTVVWGNKFHAVPFLIYCAPGVPMLQPFLHHNTLECIAASGGRNQSLQPNQVGGVANSSLTATPTYASLRGPHRKYPVISVPSPIGALRAASVHLTIEWIDELFHFLRRGAAQTTGMPSGPTNAYSDVFECRDTEFLTQPKPEKATNNSGSGGISVDGGTGSQWGVPLKHRNVIGCGLAEVVLAIDRYAAMLARRDITYAKACWGVLVDSKADVQPYLRNSAVAIEKELIAATGAHEAVNAALGDPVRRLPLTLVDYPSLVGW